MNEKENPFFIIYQELKEQRALIEEQKTLIEKFVFNQQPVILPDYDKYEGIEIALEELKCAKATIYCNIDKIPHKKVHGRLLFNKAELRAYIKNEGKK